jgi:hypothetical protein
MKSTSLKNLNHILRKKKESLKNNSRASSAPILHVNGSCGPLRLRLAAAP